MGVWIETVICSPCSSENVSHPVWVCGLKQNLLQGQTMSRKSHPVWVCGLKHFGKSASWLYYSHTLYGCVD